MTTVTIAAPADLETAAQAINEVMGAHGAAIPAKCWAMVSKGYVSLVDRVANSADAFYAMAQQLDPGPARDAAATLAAQLALMCVQYQWWAIGQTDRGGRIALAMRRLLGDDTTGQAEADDPAQSDNLIPDAP